ncbi:DsbA family oxidoreductase, partial [bacterium]|nr:DsbA family oxidoreductase [bacterium]
GENDMAIDIKLTSDFICPWCLIGEKVLFETIDALPEDIDVNVQWLPFELNPHMPKQGMDRKQYRTNKFGSWEKSQQLDAKTVEAGKAYNIDFNYELIERTPNTFDAHRLSWLAGKKGKQRHVVEAILNAYFSEGLDIGDPEILIQIANESGIEQAITRPFLEGAEGIKETRSLLASTNANGIRGVPHFTIEDHAFVGIDSPDALRQLLININNQKTRQPQTTTIGELAL